MARPGFIAALLLPLPFAALPLVAVLLGGPSGNPTDETAYVPIIEQAAQDNPSLAQELNIRTSWVDDLKGCNDLAAES